MQKVNIAYEPIWVISKGNPNHKSASSKDAEEAHKFIRCSLAGIFDERTDGGLVGNVSLTTKSFAEIVKFCNS